MLFFHHAGKTSSIPPPAGELSAAIIAVARRGKEYHVVAAVEGHELKTPETEHRPGLERLLETIHLELDGKLFVNTQQAPTWRRGEGKRPETGVREVEIPRPSCSSRAQVGCACSRGLQASTREGERVASRERLSRPLPRAANLL
jgi:hypothetical protein